MYCKNCKNYFYIRRNLLTLFSSKKEYLCDKCYNLYPIKLEFNKVILEDYHAAIISLFEIKCKIDYNYFFLEYNKIYNANVRRKDYHVLLLDYLSLTDYTIEILNMISQLFQKNLLIITFFLKKWS